MEWYSVQSCVRPEETDLTSSKVYNFIRRNIVETEVEQEDGSILTVYDYEESKIPKESWGLYLESIQARADIDYIRMMEDL